jgi:hypothetical protein
MEFDSGSEFKNGIVTESDDFAHPPVPDRRDEERQLSVRLTAKIIVAGRELPCAQYFVRRREYRDIGEIDNRRPIAN